MVPLIPQTEDWRPGAEMADGTAWPLVNAGVCWDFRRGPEVSDDCVGVPALRPLAGPGAAGPGVALIASLDPFSGKNLPMGNAGGGGGGQAAVTTVPRANRGRGAGTVSGLRKPRTWRGEGSGGKRFF